MRFGAFDLEQPIGEGGMGVVYRARHRRSGAPVAIKVLRAQGGQDPVAALQHEVRAQAMLRHPSVLHVLDQGATPAGGPVEEGLPWFAAEFASGGGLSKRTVRSWADVRAIALDVLDALAHAHARGVLHRDLKPANLLMCTDRDARPGLKVADWGLAWLVARTGAHGDYGGTPGYMAPEQKGAGPQGPWTDIYGVGCVVWSLLCGTTPPGGVSRDLVAAFQPRVPIPDACLRWIRDCIEIDPALRWSCAADATVGLMELPERWSGGSRAATPVAATRHPTAERGLTTGSRSDEPTVVQRAAAPVSGATGSSRIDTLRFDKVEEARPAVGWGGEGPVARIDIPEDWRRAEPQLPLALFDAGLGLAEVRRLPILGREAEQDALWRELRGTAQEERARSVFIRGATGLGKSHLARWLVERAEELGAAIALHVRHSVVPGAGDGVRAALIELIEHRVTRSEVLERMLLRLLQRGALEEALRALAAALMPGRVFLVWIDDAQWGAESLELVLRLADLPLLVVATVQQEALAASEQAAEVEDRMMGTTCLDLAPLSRLTTEQLVGELVRVDRRLASEIAERASGNPLFAAQILFGLSRSGGLRPSPHGFRLRRQEVALPVSLGDVWQAQLDRLREASTADDLRALQLAATLGLHVRSAEWAAVLDRVGARRPAELVAALVDRGLARTTSASDWSFAHPMLREAVLAGRPDPTSDESVCAAVLVASSPGDHERIGRHLLAAGAPAQAYGQLARAARSARGSFGHSKARALHQASRRALVASGAGRRDPRWMELALDTAETLLSAGQPDAAQAVERFERTLQHSATAEARAQLAYMRGRLALRSSQPAEAVSHFEQAVDGFRRSGATNALCRASAVYGGLLSHSGQLERGREVLLQALQETPEAYERALVIRRLATHHLSRGNLDEAERYLREGLAIIEDGEQAVFIAMTHNLLGEVARMRGDRDCAREYYERSVRMFRNVGYSSWAAELNLATMELSEGNYPRARWMVRETLKRHTDMDHLDMAVHTIELACAAGLGEQATVKEHLAWLEQAWEATGHAEPDCAVLLAEAASAVREHGHEGLARRVGALASHHRDRLGRSGKV